jgi:hypothetical protein
LQQDIMPTTPNMLAAALPQPGAEPVKHAAPAKPAGTDFRQALAVAGPATGGDARPKGAPAGDAALPAVAELATAIAAGGPNITPEITPAGQPPGGRRVKKPVAQKPDRNAASTPVQSGPLTPAIPLATQPITAPILARSIAAPVFESGVARAGPHRPELPSALASKPNPATPAKPETVGVLQTGMPAGNVAASHPAALHAAAKTADLTRQIAAALPAGSIRNSVANPALHILLHPETLGSITVKITRQPDGDTAVILSASRPETLATLKHDTENLGQILTNAGVPEANRRIDFQTMPVAATQASSGLGNATGQFAGDPSGQGGAGGQPGQQPGTRFAGTVFDNSIVSESSAAAQPRIASRAGVDVIA